MPRHAAKRIDRWIVDDEKRRVAADRFI